jgi:type IV secretion system protein VirD4
VLLLALGVAGLSTLALTVAAPIFIAVPLGVFTYRRLMRWRGTGDAYGTARGSGFADLTAGGLIGGDSGLIMGTAGYTDPPTRAEGLAALVNPALPADLACRSLLGAFGSRLAGDAVIRINDYIHGAVFAPAGAGKGVGFLIPNALSYPKSLVINDTQGSIYSASADVRRRQHRHRIVRLDAFEVCGPGGDALNPMEFLPPADAPDFLDACRDLANLLVVRQGTEHDPHWNDSAERVLTVFICFIAACERDPAKRNLLSVRKLISGRDAYLATLSVMKTLPGIPDVVKQQGETLSWLADKELNRVLSVTHHHTAWMDGPAVSAFLSRSSFDPKELKGGRLTVYNVLPPERLVTMAPLSRAIFGTIIRTITRGRADERHPVLFLIDEAAHMGRMQIFEDAVTLMRGYGIRIFFAFQSVNQVQKVYVDNAQTILDNLNTQMYFGVNSFEGAEHVSKLIGDCTIQTTSLNDSRSQSNPTGMGTGREPAQGNASTSTSVTTNETGRRWIKPEEIRTSPPISPGCSTGTSR